MEEAARISRELDLPKRKPESVNSYPNLAALHLAKLAGNPQG
jgi:hypothetical protein